MKQITSVEDEMRGRMTFELEDGRYLTFETGLLRDHSLAEILSMYGVEANGSKRVPVFQRGREIGSLPDIWHPSQIRSTSYFYRPRQGDFVRDGDKWIAASGLGPGDLEAIPDFVFGRAALEEPI